MKRYRRRFIGRRRYSWERGQNSHHKYPKRNSSAVEGVASGLVALLLFYVVLRPVFWTLVAIIGVIASCFLITGAFSAWRKLSKNYRAPRANEGEAQYEKAIGHTADQSLIEAASDISNEVFMAYDSRFALIDSDGDARFPAIIKGTFQIGKGRDELPTRIEDFARAILIDKKGGRFICADGRKPGILKFSGRAKEARAYRLDPLVAAKVGVDL